MDKSPSRDFQFSCTFYCVLQLPSSGVFSLSHCVLRRCDLCGLLGVLLEVSSPSGLRRGLSSLKGHVSIVANQRARVRLRSGM